MGRLSSYIVLFVLFILVMVIDSSEEANTGGRGGSSSRSSRGNSAKTLMAINGGTMRNTQINERTLPRTRTRGFAFSAWGIIALVVGTIFFFTTVYYFILFYPILCARERKYDVMESSPV